jgi:hypothetical protein
VLGRVRALSTVAYVFLLFEAVLKLPIQDSAGALVWAVVLRASLCLYSWCFLSTCLLGHSLLA